MASSAPIRVGILTVSDRSSRGQREDLSGPALRDAVEQTGADVTWLKVLPDDVDQLKAFFVNAAKSDEVDLVLSTGGTGFSTRDVTPEATLAVIDRQAPGLAEAIRAESLEITPHAMLSRNVAGILNRMLIINLSGSPRAAVEQFEVVAQVLPHAVQLLRDDPRSELDHGNPVIS